jgi:hypothetical protein
MGGFFKNTAPLIALAGFIVRPQSEIKSAHCYNTLNITPMQGRLSMAAREMGSRWL